MRTEFDKSIQTQKESSYIKKIRIEISEIIEKINSKNFTLIDVVSLYVFNLTWNKLNPKQKKDLSFKDYFNEEQMKKEFTIN